MEEVADDETQPDPFSSSSLAKTEVEGNEAEPQDGEPEQLASEATAVQTWKLEAAGPGYGVD
ncbi:unnamed protein product, partial [Symbiodinium sp. CCMP2456]